MPILEKFDGFNRRLSGWFEWVGLGGLLVMMAVTCIDVVGAKIFRSPLYGALDIDLEYNGLTAVHCIEHWRGRGTVILTEHFGRFQHLTGLNHAFEFIFVDEIIVLFILLTGSRFSRGRRNAEHHVATSSYFSDDTALTDA